jgi:hypothetical protein
MSDTSKSEEIYTDGEVPADADLNPDGGDAVKTETHVETETTTHSTEGQIDNG